MEGLQVAQALVARDDDVGCRGERAGEHIVVVGIGSRACYRSRNDALDERLVERQQPSRAETTTLVSSTRRIALGATRGAHGVDFGLNLLLAHRRKARCADRLAHLEELAACLALERIAQRPFDALGRKQSHLAGPAREFFGQLDLYGGHVRSCRSELRP